MSGEEEEMLIRLLCGVSGHIDPEYMGKPAIWLAKRAALGCRRAHGCWCPGRNTCRPTTLTPKP